MERLHVIANRLGLRDVAETNALIGVVLGVAFVLAFGLWFGLQRADREVGSNAVGVGAVIAEPNAGDNFCVNEIQMPDSARRVEFWLAQTAAEFELVAVSDRGTRASRTISGVPMTGLNKFELPRFDWRPSNTQALCVVPESDKIAIGGAATGRLPGDRPATLNGEPNPINEPSVHFYSQASDRPVKLAQLFDVFARSKVFHGPLFPWVMLATLLAALAASAWGLLCLITAQRRTVRRLAFVFMAVSFSWCSAWSVMSPPFQGNDEPEHFANLEHIAATGKAQDLSARNPRKPYSTHQQRSMEAYHHSSVVIDGAARPFWTPERATRLDSGLRSASRSDGGGYTISASGHSGLYYALFTPAYHLTSWMQPANQLVALRIVNSAAASVVALLAVLSAALLLGDGRRYAAAAAGAMVAFQPMFAYVSGAINNDTMVNVAGATALYLLLWLARRGWEIKREIALGFVSIVGPVGKLTGVATALFTALMVLLLVVRDRSVRAARGGFTVLVSVIASAGIYLGLTRAAGWPSALVNHHRDTSPSPDAWIPSLSQRIDYILQTAFPWIELTGPMTQVSQPFRQIYIIGGFADLFWHRIAYPMPVYKMISALLIVVLIAGLVALWRYRRWVLENWLPVCIVALHVVAVYAMVGWAYAIPGGRPELAEQGRYIFPALAALAVAAAGAGFGLPRKLRTFGWGGLVGLFCAFGIVTYFYGAFNVYS